jgi:hypothetical protein
MVIHKKQKKSGATDGACDDQFGAKKLRITFRLFATV